MGSYAQGDSLTDYETIPEDEKENSNGTSALGDYAIQVLPELPLDDSLLQGNSSAGIEQPTVIPFASRAINWRKPGTATDPTSSTAYINGYFSSWNVWSFNPVLNAQQNIQNQAKNIDLILRQSKASFAALELNESLIAQEFYNITDALKATDDWLNNKIIAVDQNYAKHFNNLTADIISLKNIDADIYKKLSDRQASIDYLAERLTSVNKTFTDHVNRIDGVNSGQQSAIDSVASRITSVNKTFTDHINRIDGVNSGQQSAIDSVASRITSVNKTFTDHINRIDDVNSAQQSAIDSVASRITSVNKTFTDHINRIDDVNLAQQSAIDSVANRITSVDNAATNNIIKLDNRLKKIEAFDFGSVIDLTVLVSAINAVGSKVQKLVDLFNVTKVEPGTFTFFLQGSIKTQTDAIIQALSMVDESLNDNFVNYFDDSINGKFWKAFKEFDDFQMAVFFGVFFDNYRLELEKTWVNTLEVWNTTNGYLDSSYNALVIITQWLKQIYEKPGTPAIVNVPPFDYERLERMLEKISIDPGEEGEGWFGKLMRKLLEEIVKGGFSLLETAITTLGAVIETAIKEAAEFYKVIADFLDGLLDKLIGLIVPEDTNFISSGFDGIKVKFNVKFGALLGLADSLKDLFTPRPRDFKQAVSFDFLGAKFEPDFSMIDPYVKKFRVVMSLSLWMSVVVFIFRKITGTGDLVNDN